MDEWDNFLNANKEQIWEFGSIGPVMLLLKEDQQPTVMLLEGFENGDKIVKAIGSILSKTNPDSYIFSCLTWGTEFGDKVFGENPKYEHVADMPLDDRTEHYIQIEVIKPGRLGRSYMASINRDNQDIFYDEAHEITESKFILSW